jgi:uncharacterized protein
MQALIATLMEENQARLARPLVRRNIQMLAPGERIAVAMGMRRSGKTCLMIQAMQDLLAQGAPEASLLFLSFEDDRLQPLDLAGAARIIDAFYAHAPENHERTTYLFLDEIHALPDWSRLVRRLQDTRKVRLYLTGSSAKMLSREIATELRGRSLATEVWPYGFTEWLAAAPARAEQLPKPPFGQRTLDLLRPKLVAYLDEGGFPEVRGLEAALRLRLLQDYVDVVVFRDVVERHGISNLPLARYLTRILLRSAGRSLSLNKLHNDLHSQGRKVAKDTLYEYVNHFEDAYLCFAVPLHQASPRKAETAPKKVYCVDPGLIAAFRMGGEDLGQRFENMVYLDLRRQGCEVAYYLTQSRKEVDFVVRYPDGRQELIQVCWDTRDPDTLAREEEALAEAELELGLEGRIITMSAYLEQQARASRLNK